MAQSGYTPIQLYRTTTAGAAPSAVNLSNGELALNYNAADMALYAKNGSGSVIRLINNPAGLKYPTADGTANQFVTTDGAGNLSWDTAVGTIAIASSNGFAGTSSGGHSPTLTLSTTVTGVLKGNGTAISAAVSGTDYAPATSGSSILYGNGSGGFSNVTIGSGVSFAGGVLSATGTGGTITGSGTANYVSKFSSSTALTNSVIYDDGTNVGIGTNSPLAKLDVNGKAQINFSTYTAPSNPDLAIGSTGIVHISEFSATAGTGGQVRFASTQNGYFASIKGSLTDGSNNTAGNLLFLNRGASTDTSLTERMRIDSSGNVGIGVAPSAWGSSLKVLQINTGASLASDLANLYLNANAYYNGTNWIYSTSNFASRYTSGSGSHYWYTAPSGTAGNPITFTQAMTLDASGNLGIGTSSFVYATSGRGLVELNGSSSALYGLKIGNTAYGYLAANTSITELAANGASQPLVFTTNSAERMRIDSSGNVGIGTTGPTYQLQLSTDSAAKPSTNTWTIASDERIKNVTGEYTKGLAAVCALRPVTYEYNGKAGFAVDGKENISIIAQEAMAHFPECVGTFEAKLNEDDEDKTTLYNWNGHALTFALVNAIKEQQAMINDLKSRIEQLEAKA